MLSIAVLGINFKTADLQLREAVARGSQILGGERGIFFRHPLVLLSTCNRTEFYFSAGDLAEAHTDLLAHLRLQIGGFFEQRLYSCFGLDCFVHLCRVAAGLDSAMVGETEIQRQVRVAYSRAKWLPSCLHYAFQKALKVSKLVRHQWELEKRTFTLYGTLWQLAEWKGKRILLVGYSEINRGLLSFLMHKGVVDISLCTKNPAAVKLENVHVCNRSVLNRWQTYDVIVCASQAENYLIRGQGHSGHFLFDLSVPRNVDPEVGKSAVLYNIDQLIEEQGTSRCFERCEALIWENAVKLARIYCTKTQHVLESGGRESHL